MIQTEIEGDESGIEPWIFDIRIGNGSHQIAYPKG